MGFKYIRPDENMVYGGAVATSAGTDDSTHTNDWLVDGRNRPARAITGTVQWDITGLSAKEVGAIVLHSHTIDASRAITIGGGVSATLTGPTARTNNIPVNPWVACTPATTASLTVAIASNSVVVVIAEVIAGKLRETERHLPLRYSTEPILFKVANASPFSSVPELDLGLAARRLSVVMVVSTADKDALTNWWEATRNDTRPSVVIPDDTVNDAFVVKFTGPPRYAPLGNGNWEVSMTFEEWPRTRWIPS